MSAHLSLALATKRAQFPLRAPRTLTLAWWPVHAYAAAVDGYHQAFFMCFRWETLQ